MLKGSRSDPPHRRRIDDPVRYRSQVGRLTRPALKLESADLCTFSPITLGSRFEQGLESGRCFSAAPRSEVPLFPSSVLTAKPALGVLARSTDRFNQPWTGTLDHRAGSEAHRDLCVNGAGTLLG